MYLVCDLCNIVPALEPDENSRDAQRLETVSESSSLPRKFRHATSASTLQLLSSPPTSSSHSRPHVSLK